MFCQKCGTENDDSAVFCNKCGASMNSAVKKDGATVAEARAPKKGIAIAVVAILLVAGCGLAFWHFGNGNDNSAAFTPTDGTFVLTDSGSTNYDQSLLCTGTVTITMKNGTMSSNVSIDKKDVVESGITISPTVIKRYTTDTSETYNTSMLSYSPMDDMKKSFGFLADYNKAGVMCTFSNGSKTVDAYKFTHIDGQHAIYVSTEGIIYEWCQSVDDLCMKFYLNGWSRTSNGSGNYH